MPNPLLLPLLDWARKLRYPTLFKITAALFVVSWLFPDPIPFVEEILFGLGTLLLPAIVALAKSINTIPIQLNEKLGKGNHKAGRERVHDVLRKVGFAHAEVLPVPADGYEQLRYGKRVMVAARACWWKIRTGTPPPCLPDWSQ